jgi:LynF/TruF/PatF family peptide O-prenyltransferase
MKAERFSIDVETVRRFYESDVVIETFNEGFQGRWHTRVTPDIPGIDDSDHYVCHLLGLGRKHRALDFGSGSGVTTCGLATRTGARFRGLNVSAKQVELASDFAALAGLAQRVGFDAYAGKKFPYPAGSFDRATFFESPCHVPHKPLLFKELFRVLKPGGACAGQDWLLAKGDISQTDYEAYIRPIEVSCEVSLLSLAGYRRLMERAGFVNVRAIDGRDLDLDLSRGFTKPTRGRIRLERSDSMATRLRLGNIALSNAFHRGLFTIGFVYGEKPGRRPARAVRATTRSPPPSRSRSRLVTDAELAPEMYAPEKNLACLEFHRASFDVPSSPPLEAFRRLVQRSHACTLETSTKVEERELSAARFNLFYHGTHQPRFLERIFAFFDEVERASRIRFDRAKIQRFLRGHADLPGVRKVVTGIDLRRDRASSRLKLWFMLSDAPELVKRALALHGDPDPVKALRLHDEFLVGFDLCFDGTTRVKVYPDVRPEELKSPRTFARLGRSLPRPTLEAMRACVWTHVYFGKHNRDIVLQLHPADPDTFVRRYLPREPGHALNAVYDGCRLLDMVVSVEAAQLAQNKVDRFAIYHMPASVPSRAAKFRLGAR